MGETQAEEIAFHGNVFFKVPDEAWWFVCSDLHPNSAPGVSYATQIFAFPFLKKTEREGD